MAVGLMAGVVALAVSEREPVSEVSARLPERGRLSALVEGEQGRVERLRGVVADLRQRLGSLQTLGVGREAAQLELNAEVIRVRERAGLSGLTGPGLVVTVDDAGERAAAAGPDANINDFIIHSQDVRAMANGLWAAGAEAVAVNGERVIPTSALLCVGNTLLLNGTVHAPPYMFVAIGDPDRLKERFLAHELVKRFAADAGRFGLGFRVEVTARAVVPAYRGSTGLRHAAPG